MLFEIVLYVKQRMAGRVMVGDSEIVAVTENGRRRTPKFKSFKEAVRHIMDNTDLEPVGQPERKSSKGHFTSYKYTYRKPDVYVQTRYNRWACAYPVENHWMVKRAGKEAKTRFETKDRAMADVDAYVGYDYVHDLRFKTVDESHQTERATSPEQDEKDLFG